MTSGSLRNIPSVSDILKMPMVEQLAQSFAHPVVVASIRAEIDELRMSLQARNMDVVLNNSQIAEAVVRRVQRRCSRKFQRVINATGILLHTNLGRAPLAEEALRAIQDAGSGYVSLEIDLDTGQRSSRQAPIRDWLCLLTGAESATVVNNNAAATVIALRALAAQREVVISRGHLVEIGGGFRIPEILAASGAILREVGTTNITRPDDYEGAIRPTTAAIMRVHPSNFHIAGHAESVPLSELVKVAKKHDIALIDDIGSGALVDMKHFGLEGEPSIEESLSAGADLVLCSGDKLLGGPQAGMILGRQDLIQRIERDPLMRAFRLDKLVLAALEATLRLYAGSDRAMEAIPLLRLLSYRPAELMQRARHLCERLSPVCDAVVTAEQDSASVGGGAVPGQSLPTWVVRLRPDHLGAEELARRLRTGSPPVISRVREQSVLLDVRTVFPQEEDELEKAVREALATDGSMPKTHGDGE